MKWLDGIIDSMDMNLSKLQKISKDRAAWSAAWCAAVHGVTKSQTLLSDWTTTEAIFLSTQFNLAFLSLIRSWQPFSIRVYTVHILAFLGHMVSVTTSFSTLQLWSQSSRDNT